MEVGIKAKIQVSAGKRKYPATVVRTGRGEPLGTLWFVGEGQQFERRRRRRTAFRSLIRGFPVHFLTRQTSW